MTDENIEVKQDGDKISIVVTDCHGGKSVWALRANAYAMEISGHYISESGNEAHDGIAVYPVDRETVGLYLV